MTVPTQAPPFPPEKIYRLSTAFWHSKVLVTAAELGVFAMLGDGPATSAQIAAKLGLRPPALDDFLDALVALGVLEREDGVYRNTPEADLYLVPGKRYFMGTYLGFVENFMRPTWDRLGEVLRNGPPDGPQPPSGPSGPSNGQAGPPNGQAAPQAPAGAGEEFFEHTYSDLGMLRMFVEAQDALSSEIGWELVRHIDWSRWTQIVDLGGARGNVAGILLQANPHLQATVFDMPPLEPLFDEHLTRQGVRDRARYQGGDWFADPLPEGEALLCGHALHNWDDEHRRTVMAKAFQAVRPGGVFMVYDLMIDEDRSQANPLLLSLAMTLSVGGSGYTAAQCRQWMQEAGFTGIETVSLTDVDGHTVVIGHKPA